MVSLVCLITSHRRRVIVPGVVGACGSNDRFAGPFYRANWCHRRRRKNTQNSNWATPASARRAPRLAAGNVWPSPVHSRIERRSRSMSRCVWSANGVATSLVGPLVAGAARAGSRDHRGRGEHRDSRYRGEGARRRTRPDCQDACGARRQPRCSCSSRAAMRGSTIAKSKAEFGARPRMLGAEETLSLTSHPIGGVCPFGLGDRACRSIATSACGRSTRSAIRRRDRSTASVRVTPRTAVRAGLSGTRWLHLCWLPGDVASGPNRAVRERACLRSLGGCP